MRPNKKNLAPIGELPTVAYYLKTAGEHFVKFAKKNPEYSGYSDQTVAVRKIAKRAGVSFAYAKAAYESAGGNITRAIALAKGLKKNPAKFDRCVKAVKKRGGANPYAVCTAAGTRGNGKVQRYKLNLGRTNPADAAAERYEYFHGRPPETDTVIKTPIHRHAVLSGIGELKELLILAISGDRKVRLEGFKGALLAETEKGTQLYIKGGDQSVNLKDFGITDPHESEILGALLNVVYFTTKDHLIPEDGGTANYKHKFVNEKLRAPRKYVFGQKGARLPMVGYDVRNKLLSIQGGTYKIVAEGIDG